MIVLKNLAQEFEMDDHRLRSILREKFGHHKRWKWESAEDPELAKIRAFLTEYTSSKMKAKRSQPSKPAAASISPTHPAPSSVN